MDLERGIPKEELDVNIFGGGLQTGAFSQKIRFLEGLKEVLNGQGQSIKTLSDVLGLAIAMCTDAKDHSNALLSYFGLDPAAEIALEIVHVQSLYMDFMLYFALAGFRSFRWASSLSQGCWLWRARLSCAW